MNQLNGREYIRISALAFLTQLSKALNAHFRRDASIRMNRHDQFRPLAFGVSEERSRRPQALVNICLTVMIAVINIASAKPISKRLNGAKSHVGSGSMAITAPEMVPLILARLERIRDFGELKAVGDINWSGDISDIGRINGPG